MPMITWNFGALSPVAFVFIFLSFVRMLESTAFGYSFCGSFTSAKHSSDKALQFKLDGDTCPMGSSTFVIQTAVQLVSRPIFASVFQRLKPLPTISYGARS